MSKERKELEAEIREQMENHMSGLHRWMLLPNRVVVEPQPTLLQRIGRACWELFIGDLEMVR